MRRALVPAACLLLSGAPACAQPAFCTPSVWRTELLAGNGSNGQTDGFGPSAALSGPYGLALDDARGVLYISNKATFCAIRAISLSSRTLSTLAGNGTCLADVDGVGAAAVFLGPGQLSLDAGGGLLYIAATTAPGCSIRRMAVASRAVTTIAGVSAACGQAPG